jgi:hypothetical protein
MLPLALVALPNLGSRYSEGTMPLAPRTVARIWIILAGATAMKCALAACFGLLAYGAYGAAEAVGAGYRETVYPDPFLTVEFAILGGLFGLFVAGSQKLALRLRIKGWLAWCIPTAAFAGAFTATSLPLVNRSFDALKSPSGAVAEFVVIALAEGLALWAVQRHLLAARADTPPAPAG